MPGSRLRSNSTASKSFGQLPSRNSLRAALLARAEHGGRARDCRFRGDRERVPRLLQLRGRAPNSLLWRRLGAVGADAARNLRRHQPVARHARAKNAAISAPSDARSAETTHPSRHPPRHRQSHLKLTRTRSDGVGLRRAQGSACRQRRNRADRDPGCIVRNTFGNKALSSAAIVPRSGLQGVRRPMVLRESSLHCSRLPRKWCGSRRSKDESRTVQAIIGNSEKRQVGWIQGVMRAAQLRPTRRISVRRTSESERRARHR